MSLLYHFLALIACSLLCSAAATQNSHADRAIRVLNSELNLEEGKAATQRLLSLLYNRYEMFDDFRLGKMLLRTFMTTDEKTWNMMKYKFALKMLEKKEYLVVFAGSSVTAGHDNFLNESYPEVYERRMRPALEALGIPFKMHNIAMGGVGCYPQNLCYETQGGDDADIYSWEQSYFCKGGQEKAMAWQSAFRSKNKGLYMDQASGALGYSGCKNKSGVKATNPAYSDEWWTPEAYGLKEWKPTAEDVKQEYDFNAKYLPKTSGGVTGVQITGAWISFRDCKLPYCDATVDKGRNCICEQATVFQNYCHLLQFANPSISQFHVTGHGARHHPTAAIHMLRGESIVWYHAHMLLDAIYMIEHDLERGDSYQKLITEYQKVLDTLRPDNPKIGDAVSQCSKWHCDKKLECFDDYRPRWNDRLSLFKQVVQNVGWHFSNASLNDWQIRGQYLDTPTHFGCYGKNVNETCDNLSFKVMVQSVPEVQFITSVGPQDFKFYVDLNVPDDKLVGYKKPSDIKPWESVEYEKDRFILTKIPPGRHVVTASARQMPDYADSKGNPKKSLPPYITHMLTWKDIEE